MNHQETYDMLYNAGFTTVEIDRLLKLRQDYIEKKDGHMSPDYYRLEFIRWLVKTGKLTEEIA